MMFERQIRQMLTATYSQIAISIEQNNAHEMLANLQDNIQKAAWNYQQHFDMDEVNLSLKKLLDFNHFCRHRKIETLMIPAIRRSSNDMHRFIAELDFLGIDPLKDIHFMFREKQIDKDPDEINAEKLLSLMEQYCHNFSKRLEKEELELLPIARRVLSNDDWFSIAVDCLSDEPSALQIDHIENEEISMPLKSGHPLLH
jgi:hypothetical protein